MISHPDLAGHLVRPDGRRPESVATGRVCVKPDCSTKLSMYNRKDTCFRHTPIRFPRTRGRIKSV